MTKKTLTMIYAILLLATGCDRIDIFDEVPDIPTNAAISSFSFPSLGVTASVNQASHTISATVPYGTDVTALIPGFATTGISVYVGSILQISEITPNDFSAPVSYTVNEADGSTVTYIVSVTVASASSKSITSFSFETESVTATINESTRTIAATVPYGTDVTSLIASFTSTGTSVHVGTTLQVSGTTPNDFSDTVTYTVTAADGSRRDYTVTVTVALSTDKSITSFTLAGITADISESTYTITATVPWGTDVTGLVATFATTGTAVHVGSTLQVSGSTANNFSDTVTYTVTAEDGSTQDYDVIISIAPSSEKSITWFSLAGVTAVIDENALEITIMVPDGTGLTSLVASFTTTGVSVDIGGITQVSGSTANNFSSAVTYTVTADDGSSQDYLVTVNIDPLTMKSITWFSVAGVTASINKSTHTITAIVPNGTDASNLVAVFATTGNEVRVATIVQTSGITGNDFTGPVTYTVFAADSSSRDYTVTVTVASGTAYELLFNAGSGSAWFGGDARSSYDPNGRNVGQGQSVLIEQDMILESFSFYITGSFTDYNTSIAHDVTVRLNVRDSAGSILNTIDVVVTASFAGGWVTWSNINMTANAGTTLIFSAYVPGGSVTYEFDSGIRMDNTTSYANGLRYSISGGYTDSQMETWSNWKIEDYDLHFWLQGETL